MMVDKLILLRLFNLLTPNRTDNIPPGVMTAHFEFHLNSIKKGGGIAALHVALKVIYLGYW